MAPTRWAAREVEEPVGPSVDMPIEPLANNTQSRVTVVMDLEGHGIGKVLVPLIVRPAAAKLAPRSFRTAGNNSRAEPTVDEGRGVDLGPTQPHTSAHAAE